MCVSSHYEKKNWSCSNVKNLYNGASWDVMVIFPCLTEIIIYFAFHLFLKDQIRMLEPAWHAHIDT